MDVETVAIIVIVFFGGLFFLTFFGGYLTSENTSENLGEIINFEVSAGGMGHPCLLYTSPSPRDRS